jgi:hypothetical protein
MFGLFDTFLPFPYFGPDFKEDSELSEEGNKYVFTFNFGHKVDPSLVKISVKNSEILRVTYHSKTENDEVHISSDRSIPEDADLETIRAIYEDEKVTVTVDKLPPKKKEPEEPKEIEITFDDDEK